MKSSINHAAENAITFREKIANNFGEQFGKETEEKLGLKLYEIKSFDHPNTTHYFPNGKIDRLIINDKTISRLTLEPGWHLKTTRHFKHLKKQRCYYLLSGSIKIKTDLNEEFELQAGDIATFETGYEVWVAGENPAIFINFQNLLYDDKAIKQ